MPAFTLSQWGLVILLVFAFSLAIAFIAIGMGILNKNKKLYEALPEEFAFDDDVEVLGGGEILEDSHGQLFTFSTSEDIPSRRRKR